MGIANLQRMSWSFGLLSRRLLGRADLQAYRAGAQTLTNWLVNASGSLEYRGGTTNVRQLDNDAQLLIPLGRDDVIALTSAGGKVYSGAGATEIASFTKAGLQDELWTVLPAGDYYRQFINWDAFGPYSVRLAFNLQLNLVVSNPDLIGAVPGGRRVSHGVTYGQRLVVGGGEHHPQTILGSRTPDPEDGVPRYTDWEQKDTVEEVNEDFQTAGAISAGATSVSVDKVDSQGDNVVFAGDVAIKDRTTFRFGSSSDVYTATKTVTKGGTVSDDPVTIEFEPAAVANVADNTRLHIIHTTFEVLPSHSFEWTIDTGAGATEIRWLAVYRRTLVIGCDNGVAIARELAPDREPEIEWRPAIGVARLMPAVTPFGVVAISADCTRLYEVLRDRDLCLYNEDLFRYDKCQAIAWQQLPTPRIWAVTDSGELYSQTVHDPNQVLAWSKWDHPAEILSVCVTPGGSAGDRVYVIAKYASDQVHLERISEPADGDQDDRVYVDGAVELTVGASGVVNLPARMQGHADRRLWVVKVDSTAAIDAVQEYQAFDGAQTATITTRFDENDEVLVGFQIVADMETTPLDESIDPQIPGSAIGQDQRTAFFHLGLVRSGEISAGPTFDKLESVLGDATELYTGNRRLTSEAHIGDGPLIVVRKDTPSPATLTYIMAEAAMP